MIWTLKTRLKQLTTSGLHGVIPVADVAVLIPTLGRPQHIAPLLKSLYDTTDNAVPVFLCSDYDYDVHNAIKKHGERIIFVKRPRNGRGDYARKINVGYRNTTEPYMFLAATDLKFHPKWLENAMDRMNSTVHVVGTNDLGNKEVMRGRHSTHTLVSREYVDKYGTIDEPGKVLCEKYYHEYVDNEFVETAMSRNAFDIALNSLVEHMHPFFNKGDWDASYRKWKTRTEFGEELFKRRRPLWT